MMTVTQYIVMAEFFGHFKLEMETMEINAMKWDWTMEEVDSSLEMMKKQSINAFTSIKTFMQKHPIARRLLEAVP